MEFTQVSCNGCGAALQVPQSARFVTCRYCGASLEIKRTESAIYTETLDRIDQRTAAMAEDIGAIRRGQEIERLDREWALERNGFMTRDKRGKLHEPKAAAGMVASFIGAGFGILWTILACAITGSAPAFGPFLVAKFIFPMFGVLFVVGAVVGGIKASGAANRFQEAQNTYQRRREELINRADSSTGEGTPGEAAQESS